MCVHMSVHYIHACMYTQKLTCVFVCVHVCPQISTYSSYSTIRLPVSLCRLYSGVFSGFCVCSCLSGHWRGPSLKKIVSAKFLNNYSFDKSFPFLSIFGRHSYFSGILILFDRYTNFLTFLYYFVSLIFCVFCFKIKNIFSIFSSNLPTNFFPPDSTYNF